MSALDSMLGRSGEPVRCKKIGDIEMHWASSFEVGGLCLCGAKVFQADGSMKDAPSNLPASPLSAAERIVR